MLSDFELTEDPFPIIPDGPIYNWAGRPELKDDLIDLVKGVRARDIGVTEVAVLHGEYGAGKSHALRFLKTRIDGESQKPDGEFRSLVLYVERPRVATKLNFLELHKYIIRTLGRERIQSFAQKVKQIIEDWASEKAHAASMGGVADLSSFREAAVSECKPTDRGMIRLLMRGAGDSDALYEFLAGTAACAGDEYEGRVDSDFMAAKILSDFFRVLTYDFRPNIRVCESVYLFIDECEILVEVKASESELVFNGLRELINGLPYRFGLILSFSAATALIEAIMPNHLLKRLTRPYIEVPMLTDDDAVEFLKTQINFHRPPNSPRQGTFYPFTEGAIRFVVGHINTMTPRSLFIDCKRVLERAIRRHDLVKGEEITEEMAQTILGGLK